MYPAGLVPARWWRKIELAYPGRTVALVYDAEPPPGELPALMWQLQTAAAAAGFTITVYDPDGAVAAAAPIGARQ